MHFKAQKKLFLKTTIERSMINLDFRILLDDFYSNCIFVHCTDQTHTCLFNHAHSRACYVCFENLVLAQVCKIEQNVSPSSFDKKHQKSASRLSKSKNSN